jgi:proline-specific peptidase
MAELTDKTREGYLPVPGGWIWYHAVGTDHTAVPLLVLHGGPSAGYRYLEALETLATDRCVVFYDQLGCGRSEEPGDSTLWRMERFVEELQALRRLLGLEYVHLYGHSWGGWLAIETILTCPGGVASLVLAGTSASLPEYMREVDRLRKQLPPEVYQAMLKHEQAGNLQNPDYKAAVLEFYQRHLCRMDPWPQVLIDNVRNIAGNAVYETLQGPNEFVITGNLRTWDRTDRLSDIDVPTLITVGRYDEATPTCAETLRRGIPNARLQIFEQSAHMPHIEEQERYLATLKQFLDEIDR